jgi:hypothetical protein
VLSQEAAQKQPRRDTSALQRLCHGVGKERAVLSGKSNKLLSGALPSWYTLGDGEELEDMYVD